MLRNELYTRQEARTVPRCARTASHGPWRSRVPGFDRSSLRDRRHRVRPAPIGSGPSSAVPSSGVGSISYTATSSGAFDRATADRLPGRRGYALAAVGAIPRRTAGRREASRRLTDGERPHNRRCVHRPGPDDGDERKRRCNGPQPRAEQHQQGVHPLRTVAADCRISRPIPLACSPTRTVGVDRREITAVRVLLILSAIVT